LVSDVWTDIHRIKHNSKRDPHPCQLPIHLLDRLILLSTDAGDTVLDPFPGTGTTAISAKRLGRNYIGIELDSNYQLISKAKLDSVIPDSKIGDKFVSFYLKDVITIRDIDWDYLKQFFIIPSPPSLVDKQKSFLLDKNSIPLSSNNVIDVNDDLRLFKMVD